MRHIFSVMRISLTPVVLRIYAGDIVPWGGDR